MAADLARAHRGHHRRETPRRHQALVLRIRRAVADVRPHRRRSSHGQSTWARAGPTSSAGLETHARWTEGRRETGPDAAAHRGTGAPELGRHAPGDLLHLLPQGM